MSWFVVRTKPRQEFIAKANLENQGFEFYLPELVRDTGSVEPLFPGYIFIKNQAGPTPFDKIRFTRGILNFVRFGEQIAIARQDLVDSLRQRENEFKNVSSLKPNQKVYIKDGPFKHLQAIFLEKAGKDRVVLLLKILNSNQQISMNKRFIDTA